MGERRRCDRVGVGRAGRTRTSRTAKAAWAGEHDAEAWERLHGTAYLVAVAVHEVLAFETRIRRMTRDADLAKARAAFNRLVPEAKDLRDLIVHLDAYAVGEGKRQTTMPPDLDRRYVSTLLYWTEEGGTYIALGDRQLNLSTAVEAVNDLAPVVDAVRHKHMAIAADEANAALQRERDATVRET